MVVEAVDLEFVVGYFEDVLVDLFWSADPEFPLSDNLIAQFRAKTLNGAENAAITGWARCPICEAMGLNSSNPDEINRACHICPVRNICWPIEDSPYSRMVAAIEAGDPVATYLAIWDGMDSLNDLIAEVLADGGQIVIEEEDLP